MFQRFVIVGFSLLMLAGLLQPGMAWAAGYAGKVVYAQGDVRIERGAMTLSVKSGMRIRARDVIVTGVRARVKVRLRDGSKIYVGQRSRLNIARYEVSGPGRLLSGVFEQLWGKVRYVVARLASPGAHFGVHTTTAVIGVRGTEFTVQVPPPRKPPVIRGYRPLKQVVRELPALKRLPVALALFSGRVDLRAGNHQLKVSPGRLVQVRPRQGVTIQPMKPAQIKRFKDVTKGDILTIGTGVQSAGGADEAAPGRPKTARPAAPAKRPGSAKPTLKPEAGGETSVTPVTGTTPKAGRPALTAPSSGTTAPTPTTPVLKTPPSGTTAPTPTAPVLKTP
ncbi:MAG: FecR domain-containing protein, partial [Mariprofundaceae bacterium]